MVLDFTFSEEFLLNFELSSLDNSKQIRDLDKIKKYLYAQAALITYFEIKIFQDFY